MRRIITYKREDGSVISSTSIRLEKRPELSGRGIDGLAYKLVHARELTTWREPYPDDVKTEWALSLGFAIRLADEYARRTDRMERER